MGILGSRCYYAYREQLVYQFQDKAYRDWYVDNTIAKVVSHRDVFHGEYSSFPIVFISHENYKHSRAWEER